MTHTPDGPLMDYANFDEVIPADPPPWHGNSR